MPIAKTAPIAQPNRLPGLVDTKIAAIIFIVLSTIQN